VMTVMAESRKFGVTFHAAVSMLDALPAAARAALLGAGACAVFQVTGADAALLARELFRRDAGVSARADIPDAGASAAEAALTDRLNKTRERRLWWYRRRADAEGVLLRALAVRPRHGAAEARAVRDLSMATYGAPRAAVEAELALRQVWLNARFPPAPPDGSARGGGRGTTGGRGGKAAAPTSAAGSAAPPTTRNPFDDPDGADGVSAAGDVNGVDGVDGAGRR